MKGELHMNIDKLRYDLALIYAKSKLDNALSTNKIPHQEGIPKNVDEMDYLLSEFINAYSEYCNYSEANFSIE